MSPWGTLALSFAFLAAVLYTSGMHVKDRPSRIAVIVGVAFLTAGFLWSALHAWGYIA